jgi:hypothetical protein
MLQATLKVDYSEAELIKHALELLYEAQHAMTKDTELDPKTKQEARNVASRAYDLKKKLFQ